MATLCITSLISNLSQAYRKIPTNPQTIITYILHKYILALHLQIYPKPFFDQLHQNRKCDRLWQDYNATDL